MAVKVIAELSCNHSGEWEHMLALIDTARQCGADAIKVQVWMSADDMTFNRPDDPRFRMPDDDGPWAGRALHDLYREAQTPPEWLPDIMREAEDRNLDVVASVFSPAAAWYCHKWAVPTLKIASPELPYTELIATVCETQSQMYLSTGGASLDEIDRALSVCADHVACDVTVLHCVSSYPATVADMGMRTIKELQRMVRRYDPTWTVGLSDHTRSNVAAVMGVALGATVIEKHLMLDKYRYRGDLPLDTAFALKPLDFMECVGAVRDAVNANTVLNHQRRDGHAFRRQLIDGQWVRANRGDTR